MQGCQLPCMWMKFSQNKSQEQNRKKNEMARISRKTAPAAEI